MFNANLSPTSSVDQTRRRLSPHRKAVLQALFVTFLWSTSWVLIKIGLQDIPALTFAGLRYALAFLCLLPFVLYRERKRPTLRHITPRQWLLLIVLGVLYYAVTQGGQFLGLSLLPAVTVSLMLNFTTSVVALLGIPWLKEVPRPLQWLGIGLAVAGALLYFLPLSGPSGQLIGMAFVTISVLSNAVSSVLGRQVNRSGELSPLLVTIVSMGIGGLLLLSSGLAFQGLPRLSWSGWAIVGWLALINTAFAFTLWNHTLRTLTAVESSILNSTMLVQIALLAVVFLGERLTGREVLGMALAGLGALLVQLRRRR